MGKNHASQYANFGSLHFALTDDQAIVVVYSK